MKKTLAALLATILASTCLLSIAHSVNGGALRSAAAYSEWEVSSEVHTTRADDEDLISHFTGNFYEYYYYLLGYFADVTGCNDPEDWGSKTMKRLSDEMAKIYNEYYNDIDDHPYLRGRIDPDTGEITITGIKKAGYVTPYYLYLDGKYWGEYDVDDHGMFVDMDVKNLVIPDEIDGHPVTKIGETAFPLFGGYDGDNDNYLHLSSLVIGNNIREIGDSAFIEQQMSSVTFGDHVEIIRGSAFKTLWSSDLTIHGWGTHLKSIGEYAFQGRNILSMPSFPETLEEIGEFCFSESRLMSETVIFPPSVRYVGQNVFDYAYGIKNVVVLSKDLRTICEINEGSHWVDVFSGLFVYCYSGSAAEADAKKYWLPYALIDGDSLLWDGEAVEGNVLHLDRGMTEAQLRAHLSIDGDSSEIQMDGLKDGKVVNGTTVTLFHKIAQAPGKVYTVEKEPEIVSVSVETLPKTNYFYKEAFDPDGLSLRVTYDDGTKKSVTDGYTLSGTELKLGTNTVTATYENVSTTFPVTVRYAWWQHLIRFFLLGFLWY